MDSNLITYLPPAFIMIFGGLALPLLRQRGRQVMIVLLPLLTLYQLWSIPAGVVMPTFPVAGFDLQFLMLHPFTHIFATVFCLVALGGGIFGLSYNRVTEVTAAYIYAGSAIGLTFSGDFISFFIFWEVMAIASAIVVWCGGTKRSHSAGLRYIYMHLFGGVLLLAGITSYIALSGDITLAAPQSSMDLMLHFATLDAYTVSLWLMLLGLLVNAAMPPFSAWLPDAYPEGSSTGSIFLSAFTTKSAIFALLVLFPGNHLLIYVGFFAIFYATIYGLLVNNIRRILAYGIITQLGVMVVGIGIGTPAALAGTAVVAFGHVLYKGLLYTVSGAVMEATGRYKCTDLGMLYNKVPLVAVCGAVGVLALAAPLGVGFVGKEILAEAALHDMGKAYYLMLVASAAAVFVMLLKWYWCIFFGDEHAKLKVKKISTNMKVALVGMAALCILPALPLVVNKVLGLLLSQEVTTIFYTIAGVIGQVQLLLFSALAMFLLWSVQRHATSTYLDVDWFYRVPTKRVLRYLARLIAWFWPFVTDTGKQLVIQGVIIAKFVHGPRGILSRNWSLSTTVMWSVILLGVYLVLYYSA